MVDFGLKLEDNKVVEWGDKYIRYEQLKAILKKGSHAVQRYKELAIKKPQEAFEITEAFRKGLPSRNSSRNSSFQDLPAPPAMKTVLSQASLTGISQGVTTPQKNSSLHKDETTSLLTVSNVQKQQAEGKNESTGDMSTFEYGSTATTPAPSRPGTPDSRINESGFLGVISKAASNVTDYFSQSYERNLRDSLKQVDKCAAEFETILVEDVDRVNSFYREKMDEMHARVSVLKETVALTFAAPPAPKHAPSSDQGVDEELLSHGSERSEEAYLNTPLVQNRHHDRHSIARAVATFSKRFTPLQKVTKSIVRQTQIANISLHHDDEDDHNGGCGGHGGASKPKMTEEEQMRLAREIESIQRALVDLYRMAKLLQNFVIINFTGFVKISKKHDKTLVEHKGRFKQLIRPENICNEGKEVENFANHIEQLYANWFCDRNVSDAKVQLLPKRGDGLEMDWSQLRLGYRMGMCSILGLWVCWDCIWGMLTSGQSTIGGRTAFPVFRACGGLLLLQWFWGCSVWTWTRYRVNYIYLFDFNPNIVASPLAIFNEAVDNSLVFLTNMLLYYKAGAHDIPGSLPPGLFPFLLVVYTVYQLIFPLKIRGPMWKAIWLVVTTPMTSPVFFHSYIGDIFTSMVKIFQDLAWTIFFIGSGDWMLLEEAANVGKHSWSKTTWYKTILIPLLTLLPLWFRFNQCLRRYADTGQRLPHIANAFKYALSMTVTLFGAFHPLYLQTKGNADLFQMFWMLNFVFSSLYSFFWDVYMDCKCLTVFNECPIVTPSHCCVFCFRSGGLGRPKFNMLGPRLMYPRKDAYYAIIGIDLVLRFAWVLTLVPPDSGASFALPAYLTAVSMMFELFRRTIWGFLRLENEHRSNTSGYRRVDFVPLHFTTGHKHDYKKEKERRGASVLVEIAIVTALVLAAAVASVVAAQHETEKQAVEL